MVIYPEKQFRAGLKISSDKQQVLTSNKSIEAIRFDIPKPPIYSAFGFILFLLSFPFHQLITNQL